MKAPEVSIQEAPGLNGHIHLDERLIQRIWQEGNFIQQSLISTKGKSLKVIDCGKWNLSEEGPDFKRAIIEVDQQVLHGDVELHFNEMDWNIHGHARDPAYDRVILHVVLFPSRKKTLIKNSKGLNIHTLVLLPHLYASLEEYAEEQAVMGLSGKKTGIRPPEKLPKNISGLRESAHLRWVAKSRHAQTRIKAMGWENACHRWFLEVLGYARNRSPMARIAQRVGIQDWRNGVCPEEVFQTEDGWKIRGCRPNNHPKKRLEQYSQLINQRPDWPERLKTLDLGGMYSSKKVQNRKTLGMKEKEQDWQKLVMGDAFGGTRLHTLMVDAALPLWTSVNEDAFEVWFHWKVGDIPACYRRWAKEAGLTNRKNPFGNGIAQGMLHAALK